MHDLHAGDFCREPGSRVRCRGTDKTSGLEAGPTLASICSHPTAQVGLGEPREAEVKGALPVIL